MAASTFDQLVGYFTTESRTRFLYVNLSTQANQTNQDHTMSPDFLLSNVDSTQMTPHSHKTAVIVIMSIFICITLSVTGAVFVFCKKKNSVFSLPKSDQDNDTEFDYELKNIDTDIESECSDRCSNESISKVEHSVSIPLMSRLCHYDTDSILYIPYIPEDQCKSNYYQPLSHSDSYTNIKSKDSNDEPVALLPKHPSENINNGLPVSNTQTSSKIANNYQSIQVCVEVEPCNHRHTFNHDDRQIHEQEETSPSPRDNHYVNKSPEISVSQDNVSNQKNHSFFKDCDMQRNNQDKISRHNYYCADSKTTSKSTSVHPNTYEPLQFNDTVNENMTGIVNSNNHTVHISHFDQGSPASNNQPVMLSQIPLQLININESKSQYTTKLKCFQRHSSPKFPISDDANLEKDLTCTRPSRSKRIQTSHKQSLSSDFCREYTGKLEYDWS